VGQDQAAGVSGEAEARRAARAAGAEWRSAGSADAVEQVREGHVEAAGEADEDADAGIALGAFDAPHVREREPGDVSKLLLSQPPLVTDGADVRAKPAQRVTSHVRIVVQ